METLFHAGLSNAVSATVLAVVVACLSRPLARRPAVLHWLWLLVLLKLVTPPLYQIALPRPASWLTEREPDPSAEAAVALSFVEVESPAEPWAIEPVDANLAFIPSRLETIADATGANAPAIDWLRLLAMIWLGGTATVLLVSFRRVRRFQRLLGEARPVSEDMQDWVGGLANQIGLKRSPVVAWIRARLSPMIWSLGWRPRLILPRDLWKTLDERQRSTLVVHELAHLRRRDHVVRFFELLVTALFWWHPVVWWVRHALRDAEEHCCDAWVVWAFPDAARSYAETLIETIDFLNHSENAEPLLASGFGKVDHLRKRLTMILSGTTPRLLGVRGALGLLGLAMMLLPVNATWAQKPEKPQEIDVVVKTVEDSDDVVLFTARPETVDVSEDSIRMVVKADDGPAIEVSGSLDRAIVELKKQIGEIIKKSERSVDDQKRLKALEHAIQELAKVAGEIKRADPHPDKPGAGKGEKRVMIVRRDVGLPNKTLSAEQKAEAKKLRARVEELTAELEQKARELKETQARLAKLEGTHSGAAILLNRIEEAPDGKGVAHVLGRLVADDRGEARPVTVRTPRVVEYKPIEVKTSDRRVEYRPVHVTTSGTVKRVGPKDQRVEITIGSDHPKKPAKPETVEVHAVKVPVRSEQQRIEELEKALKKLTEAVNHLKREREDSPSRK